MSYKSDMQENNAALRVLLKQAKGLPDVSTISGKTILSGTYYAPYNGFGNMADNPMIDVGVTLNDDDVFVMIPYPDAMDSYDIHLGVPIWIRLSNSEQFIWGYGITPDGTGYYINAWEENAVTYSGTSVTCTGTVYYCPYKWILIQ